MILIDEDVPESKRLSLLRWKPVQIGRDIWDKGVDDEQIAVRLRTMRLVTFSSLDRDFLTKRHHFGHANCAIAFVDASKNRFPVLVDRFLRHPSFRTHASRMGGSSS